MEAHFSAVPGVSLLVPLVLTAPALSIAVAAPLSGAIMDRWGRRPVLLTSLVIVGLAGSAGYALPSLPAILASRVVLGLGVAGSITASTALISDYLSGQERDRYLGYQSAVIWFGGTLFSQVGGLLADRHWRDPFLLFLAALAVVPMALLCVPEPDRGSAPERTSSPPTPERTRSSSAASGRLGLRLAVPYLVALLRTAAFFVIVVHLPFYLSSHFGAGGAQIGTALAVMNLSAGAAGMAYGPLAKRFPLSSLFAGIFLAMAAGYLILGLATGYPIILAGLIAAGAANGVVVPHLTLWLILMVPPATRGRAFGSLTTAIHLGQFVSPILVAPISGRFALSGAYLACAGLLVGMALLFRAVDRAGGDRPGSGAGCASPR